MTCRSLFSGRNKTNSINLPSAESTKRVVKVKYLDTTFFYNYILLRRDLSDMRLISIIYRPASIGAFESGSSITKTRLFKYTEKFTTKKCKF